MPYKILTLNNISVRGLERLPRDRFEVASEIGHPDAIMLRSADMHSMDIPASVLAIGRAGAGTNNIPVPKLSKRGVPVFNAPGANANARTANGSAEARRIFKSRLRHSRTYLVDLLLRKAFDKPKGAVCRLNGISRFLLSNEISISHG